VYRYRNDKDSPYSRLRFATRQSYESRLRIIEADLGAKVVGELKARDLRLVHQEWTKRGPTMAHGLMGMLRMLNNYGTTKLEDDQCQRLSGILHNMRLSVAKTRNTELLTAEHVEAIRNKAHLAGFHSIALAQAFQFDCMLRQRDCIGEWIPEAEPGESNVRYDGMKWMRGLRWEEIDANRMLRHTTSKRLHEVEIDLKMAPTVMAELSAKEWPKDGPVIVSEETGRPWTAWAFRATWRSIARAAGIPDGIKNMDSRGAIIKATDAPDARRGNGHADELGEYRNPNLIPPGSL